MIKEEISLFRAVTTLLVVYALLAIMSSTQPKPPEEARASLSEARRNHTTASPPVRRLCFPIAAKQLARCPITIVTAYFDVPSKRGREHYIRWMQNILSVKSCMVIFTDECHLFEQHASSHRVIMHADLEKEIGVFGQPRQFWERQAEMDPEREIHRGYWLYWVWSLKPIFVSKGAEYGFFGSEYYAWMDIGMLRDDAYNAANIRGASPPASFDPCCIHMGVPHLFEPSDLIISANGSCMTPFTDRNRVCGCAFLVTKRVAHVFRDIYLATFDEYVDRGWFVGKDQNLMNTACVENARLFRFVRPDPNIGDRWFTLAYYIMGLMPDAGMVRLHPAMENAWTTAFTF
jgi:hypothetical protein